MYDIIYYIKLMGLSLKIVKLKEKKEGVFDKGVCK